MSRAMDAAAVACELRYHHADGKPNTVLVRKLARDGRIPPPIDTDLPVQQWRWSTSEVEAYIARNWQSEGAAS